jgi:hypothetical protein
MNKELTRDIILVVIILAGIVSFFYNPLGGDMKYLQILMGGIIGWYTGIQALPLGRFLKVK